MMGEIEPVEDKFDELLDCLNHSCAMVITKLEEMIDGMLEGKVLKVISSDMSTEQMIQDWCEKSRNKYQGVLRKLSEAGDTTVLHHFIRKQ